MSKLLADFLDNYPLPLHVNNCDGENFADFFNSYLDKYFEDIDKIISASVITHPKTKVGVRTQLEKDVIRSVCNYIQRILKVYLDGHPAAAYFLFEEMVESVGMAKELLKLDIIKLDKKTYFFRTQVNHDEKKPIAGSYSWSSTVTIQDLFHAPFDKRKRVGTNRFSIPGYPCLYVSSDLLTSYRECTQSEISPLDAICLQNSRPVYVANISPLKKETIEFAKEEHGGFDLSKNLFTYAKIFPLVAACHTKIKYVETYKNEVRFKMEYIIPQLLLQWFQKHSGYHIDGIQYLSCTSSEFDNSPLYNFIFTTSFEKGCRFCPKLSILFDASDVLGIGMPDETKSLDNWVKEIEVHLYGATKKNLKDLLAKV